MSEIPARQASRPAIATPFVPLFQRLAEAAAALLLSLAGAALMVTLLAWGYTVKRHFHIDVFPGVDMLPDPPIEAAIAATLQFFGWG